MWPDHFENHFCPTEEMAAFEKGFVIYPLATAPTYNLG